MVRKTAKNAVKLPKIKQIDKQSIKTSFKDVVSQVDRVLNGQHGMRLIKLQSAPLN